MSFSSHIDDKFVNLMSFRLERFKRVDQNTYRFRCPICGDSKKNRFLARGYVYPSQQKDSLLYKCHNCGISIPVKQLIRLVDESLYKEYNLEYLKENRQEKKSTFIPQIEKFSKRRKDKFEPLKSLIKISTLNHNNPVKKYVESRKIPSNYHYKLYYSKRFMEWVNTIIPDKFDDDQLKMDEPRLVIPFIDENGYVFGVSGRSFKKNSIRYITIKFDEEKEKIYGLDDVDKTKKIYVVEGPIDSFFIQNSIALAGSDGKLDNVLDGCKFTIVLDNEPRNKEIVKKMEKMIDQGYSICIWPDSLEDYKDINDMIIGGYTSNEITNIIDKNTYSRLKAKVRLNSWKKI